MHKFAIQAYVKSYVFTTSSKTVVPLSKGKQKIKKLPTQMFQGIIYNATL